MKLHVILHSYLREKLPAEARGEVNLEMPEGSTVADVMANLGLPEQVVCAINRQLERNRQKPLQEGDEVRFFRPGAGG
ncbi:MAG: MoaD/ThiS family protein [Anaerolineaceae bacterium]|nr:MoaD/ThiS family protein [Anaerolineaceae bacterium]